MVRPPSGGLLLRKLYTVDEERWDIEVMELIIGSIISLRAN